jgi:hypothetical protein
MSEKDILKDMEDVASLLERMKRSFKNLREREEALSVEKMNFMKVYDLYICMHVYIYMYIYIYIYALYLSTAYILNTHIPPIMKESSSLKPLNKGETGEDDLIKASAVRSLQEDIDRLRGERGEDIGYIIYCMCTYIDTFYY